MKKTCRILILMLCIVLCFTTVFAETTTGRKINEKNTTGTVADEIAEAENRYTATLDEYVNTVAGYSLQYPSAFTDHFQTEDENGFTARLSDGSAEMLTERVANSSALSLKSYVKVLEARDPSVTVEYSSFEEKVRLTGKRKDGFTQADVYIVTEKWIYHVRLAWAPSRDREYKTNCGYVMNSFICDEISEG